MSKGRLEAFSDAVLAIIITIMVLELRPPEDVTLDALFALWPKLLSYLLSFVIIGIYWNNHHHLFQAAQTINGRSLWANLNLLFWLSLLPFGTAWMGEHSFAPVPVAVYGVILFVLTVIVGVLARSIVARYDRKHGAVA